MTTDLIDRPQPHDQRVETLLAAFREHFGHDAEGIAEAPGRVNLIGEHVDYNDGLVLPFAIDRSVMCAWGRAERSSVRAYSVDFDQLVEFEPLDLSPSRKQAWASYVEGVAWVFAQHGDSVGNCDLVVQGDVPLGAGLSSSAALETAIMASLEVACVTDGPEGKTALPLWCQEAENEYVGVQCGIMDQFASALSKRDHALLIDCRTLDYKHIPLRLAEHNLAIVIANSAVQRELITSAYNDRRRECEQAIARLRDLLGRPSLASLRDVRASDLDTITIDPNDVPLRRARHVVTEIDRVAEAVDAFARDDFARVGELMVASHLSLKTDYEVSSEQLDLLVGLATAQDYVLGARLTGAGFGGCTVNLVHADRIEDFARDVIAPYRTRTGLPAVMYVTTPCDGLKASRL